MKKYVVLEHLTGEDKGIRFWTSNIEDSYTSKTLFSSYKQSSLFKEVYFTDSKEEVHL